MNEIVIKTLIDPWKSPQIERLMIVDVQNDPEHGRTACRDHENIPLRLYKRRLYTTTEIITLKLALRELEYQEFCDRVPTCIEWNHSAKTTSGWGSVIFVGAIKPKKSVPLNVNAFDDFTRESLPSLPNGPKPPAPEKYDADQKKLSRKIEDIRAEVKIQGEKVADALTKIALPPAAKPPATDTANPVPSLSQDISSSVMDAIRNRLAEHDGEVKARPTLSEFFRAYMIEKLTTKAMIGLGWSERTIRNRRQLSELVIAEHFGGRIQLSRFRNSVDSRIWREAEKELERARKRGHQAHLE